MSAGPTGVLEVTVLKGENLTVGNGDTPTICHVEIVAETGDDTQVNTRSVIGLLQHRYSIIYVICNVQ